MHECNTTNQISDFHLLMQYVATDFNNRYSPGRSFINVSTLEGQEMPKKKAELPRCIAMWSSPERQSTSKH